jgi:hypothetical protein
LNFAHKSAVLYVFMSRGPQHHLGEDRRQIHPFGGQQVIDFAAIRRIPLGSDNAIVFEAA